MYIFILKTANCIVSVIDLMSEYGFMLTNATLFTSDAVHNQVDLMSVPELGGAYS